MKVTIEKKAFLSKDANVTPQQLQTPKGAASLSFFSGDMSAYGYTYICQAVVTVDIPDERTLVESAINSLRQQASAIRAEATAKCTEIEGQIQNLLAIDYTPAPADPQ